MTILRSVDPTLTLERNATVQEVHFGCFDESNLQACEEALGK